jgi:hypothetical protein
VEAGFLYSFVATKRHRRIIQIDSGAPAVIRRGGYRPGICCVDPFPTAYLKRLAEARKNSLTISQVDRS